MDLGKIILLGAIAAHRDGVGGLGPVFGYGLLFAVGIAVGLLALVRYDVARARGRADAIAGENGANTALLIPLGIGLHNFAEGLAIGQSAAAGEVSLATVLVVGFALHNATEGFGIVAPLSGERPSWGRLLLLGLIGGGPTLVGAAVGHGFTSEATSVVFLTLAGGSILYVVIQLLGVAARARRADLLSYGLLLGLPAGFVTDAVVTAGGA